MIGKQHQDRVERAPILLGILQVQVADQGVDNRLSGAHGHERASPGDVSKAARHRLDDLACRVEGATVTEALAGAAARHAQLQYGQREHFHELIVAWKLASTSLRKAGDDAGAGQGTGSFDHAPVHRSSATVSYAVPSVASCNAGRWR